MSELGLSTGGEMTDDILSMQGGAAAEVDSAVAASDVESLPGDGDGFSDTPDDEQAPLTSSAACQGLGRAACASCPLFQLCLEQQSKRADEYEQLTRQPSYLEELLSEEPGVVVAHPVPENQRESPRPPVQPAVPPQQEEGYQAEDPLREFEQQPPESAPQKEVAAENAATLEEGQESEATPAIEVAADRHHTPALAEPAPEPAATTQLAPEEGDGASRRQINESVRLSAEPAFTEAPMSLPGETRDEQNTPAELLKNAPLIVEDMVTAGALSNVPQEEEMGLSSVVGSMDAQELADSVEREVVVPKPQEAAADSPAERGGLGRALDVEVAVPEEIEIAPLKDMVSGELIAEGAECDVRLTARQEPWLELEAGWDAAAAEVGEPETAESEVNYTEQIAIDEALTLAMTAAEESHERIPETPELFMSQEAPRLAYEQPEEPQEGASTLLPTGDCIMSEQSVVSSIGSSDVVIYTTEAVPFVPDIAALDDNYPEVEPINHGYGTLWLPWLLGAVAVFTTMRQRKAAIY